MKQTITLIFLILTISACATVPVSDKRYVKRCGVSSDKKTLKIIDVAKETDTYYSVSGILLTPIIVPVTAVISGSYVLINNLYNLGEEKIKCSKD